MPIHPKPISTGLGLLPLKFRCSIFDNRRPLSCMAVGFSSQPSRPTVPDSTASCCSRTFCTAIRPIDFADRRRIREDTVEHVCRRAFPEFRKRPTLCNDLRLYPIRWESRNW